MIRREAPTFYFISIRNPDNKRLKSEKIGGKDFLVPDKRKKPGDWPYLRSYFLIFVENLFLNPIYVRQNIFIQLMEGTLSRNFC